MGEARMMAVPLNDKNRMHIMIVEDAPDLQYLLGYLFKSEGYVLSQAFNGQEALDLLQKMPVLPSLILLDIMMPIMDGFEFRQRQMQDPKLSKIPVMVMTADGNPQGRAQSLGIQMVIQKPIKDLDSLFEIAERLITQH
jgi:CheY-like chemotaxis protein